MDLRTQDPQNENERINEPSLELVAPEKIEIVVGSSSLKPTRLLLRNEDINNAEQLGFFSLSQIIAHRATLSQQNLDYVSMINSAFVELMFQIFENQTTITKALQSEKSHRCEIFRAFGL